MTGDMESGGFIAWAAPYWDKTVEFLLWWPSDLMSVGALLVSLAIAVGFLSTHGGRVWRRARPLRILRVMFSRRYLTNPSHRLDVLLFIGNSRVFGHLFGWMMISGQVISVLTLDALVGQFGARAPTTLPPWAVMAIASVLLFIAYEFGYWLDHMLAHKLPALWEFHKVHHQAEVLSPVTAYRVHPVDTVVFANIVALTMGVANGIIHFAFGIPRASVSLFDQHLILVVFGFILIQLHHSHVWIPFRGWLGRIFISPAAHQIHHSTNPIHYDKNFGSCLAIFDWMFGTLHLPAKHREHLTFGVTDGTKDPHSLTSGVLLPFVRSAEHIHSGLAALVARMVEKRRGKRTADAGVR